MAFLVYVFLSVIGEKFLTLLIIHLKSLRRSDDRYLDIERFSCGLMPLKAETLHEQDDHNVNTHIPCSQPLIATKVNIEHRIPI